MPNYGTVASLPAVLSKPAIFLWPRFYCPNCKGRGRRRIARSSELKKQKGKKEPRLAPFFLFSPWRLELLHHSLGIASRLLFAQLCKAALFACLIIVFE